MVYLELDLDETRALGRILVKSAGVEALLLYDRLSAAITDAEVLGETPMELLGDIAAEVTRGHVTGLAGTALGNRLDAMLGR